MNHSFIIYLLAGLISYVALGVFSYTKRKADSSDTFIFGAMDILLLPLWPVVIPYMLFNMVKEKPQVSAIGAAESKPYDLVGSVALTISDLRPSGRIRIGSDLHEAVSECGVITTGEKVEILGRDGLRVMVKKVAEQGASSDC